MKRFVLLCVALLGAEVSSYVFKYLANIGHYSHQSDC